MRAVRLAWAAKRREDRSTNRLFLSVASFNFFQRWRCGLKRFGLVFLVGVAAGVGLLPDSARAHWKRQSGAICRAAFSTTLAPYNEAFGLMNNNNAGTADFICPYDDDSFFPRTSVAVLNVHGFKNNNVGLDEAWTCTKFWATTSFACHPTSNSTANPGSWQLTPALNPWWSNSADFSYIRLRLQPGSGVYGFFTST